MSNTERADRALAALVLYNNETGDIHAGPETALRDLLTDAIHALGLAEVQQAMITAEGHYEEEKEG